jgi:hypothetical protein
MTSLSQPLQAVVALFEGPLSGVRFADVDAAGLSKLAAELAGVAAEVEQHEAKLIELRQGLAQRQEALLALSQRALAYARVYAEDDEELLAKLNDIALPRATKPRKAGAPKPATASSTTDGAAPVDSPQADAAQADTAQADTAQADAAQADAAQADAETEAEDVPAKTKPAYARPKVKRRLGRAASQGDSA